MKTYAGSRTIDGIVVTVDGAPLDARVDLACFTDLGFEWTYVGPSPRQLALTLLADHLGDSDRALALSEAFTLAVIANLDTDWQMTSAEIDRALADLPADGA